MIEDDPFLGRRDERTVLKPMPGGRAPLRAQPRTEAVAAPPAPSAREPAAQPAARAESAPLTEPLRWLPQAGVSPLIDAASPLLSLGALLRQSISQGDVDALRRDMVRHLQTFERQVRADGYPEPTTLTARYLLCTFLDECVLRTPWGGDGQWSAATLLVTFHNEAWGGEKFFAVLDRLLTTPQQNPELLELIYLCLAFGFQGRYGVQEGGAAALEQRRQDVYHALERVRGEANRDLSPHWQGVQSRAPKLARYVPLWVVAAVAGVLLLALYSGFSFMLNASTGPVLERIGSLQP